MTFIIFVACVCISILLLDADHEAGTKNIPNALTDQNDLIWCMVPFFRRRERQSTYFGLGICKRMAKVFPTVLIGIVYLTSAQPAAVKYYASKYDHIDLEAILNNRRMVNYYSACLLSKGPCPPEGVDLKRILPEALQTNCGRCSEKQATVALRAIKRLQKEYPKIWTQLSEKWDPDDVYVNKFMLTFGSKTGPTKPSHSTVTLLSNRFGGLDDNTDNSIDSNLHQSSTPITFNSSSNTSTKFNSPSSSTTPKNEIVSSPNIISSTSTNSDFSYEPTSSTSSQASATTTRLPPIPGLLPFNTFFTNPPIPIRPIVNLNIGANIGATVKAVKQIEQVVASIALEKIEMIKHILLFPWRRIRRRNKYA